MILIMCKCGHRINIHNANGCQHIGDDCICTKSPQDIAWEEMKPLQARIADLETVSAKCLERLCQHDDDAFADNIAEEVFDTWEQIFSIARKGEVKK